MPRLKQAIAKSWSGWLAKAGGTKHAKFSHPVHPGLRIMLPRHREVTECRAINRESRWLDLRTVEMSHYIAFIDGQRGAYGAVFPDAPGCTAMGASSDEVIANATEALREWLADRLSDGLPLPRARSADELMEEYASGWTVAPTLAMIPALVDDGRTVRANISIDAGLLKAIDTAAAQRGLTRSAFREKIIAAR